MIVRQLAMTYEIELYSYSLVHLLPTSPKGKKQRPVRTTKARVPLTRILGSAPFFSSSGPSQGSKLMIYLYNNDLPKALWSPQFFAICMWNRAVATVSCTFFRPHLPKVLRPWQFFAIFMWNRALATVLCTFCRPHLAKVLRPWQFLNIFWSSCETAETKTLVRRPRMAILLEKTRGFAPESLFKTEFTRSGSLTLPNYVMILWCGCHDDVVDMMIEMMMWLPWWWES